MFEIKKQLTILFLMIVLFPFKSFSFVQQRDSLIQLYSTLGDTISRFEKDTILIHPVDMLTNYRLKIRIINNGGIKC